MENYVIIANKVGESFYMKEIVLNVMGLQKTYNKGKTYAVNNVSFEIHAGEIVGLVGKNGAGKSTILKSVTGILPFEAGTITIAGFNVVSSPIQAKQNLGYVPDVSNAFDKMTGMEYLNFVADIFGVSKKEREQKCAEFEKVFPLGDSIHRLISSYSHGMKQKVSIMASLISSPKLWILDEPITGLDPQTSLSLLEYMKEYAKKGNAVVFSSHNLDIVQKLCDRTLIINHGILVANLNIDEFEKIHDKTLEDFFMEQVK